MAKFDKQSLCKKSFWHDTSYSLYLYCMCKVSVKALLQVDFLMYALSKHKHNPYLIGNDTKWLCLIISHFARNIFFGMTLLHASVKALV